MNRRQAKQEALRRWGGAQERPTVGSRTGSIFSGRPGKRNRFRVGYREMVAAPGAGRKANWVIRMIGEGDSWQEAFDSADRNQQDEALSA